MNTDVKEFEEGVEAIVGFVEWRSAQVEEYLADESGKK